MLDKIDCNNINEIREERNANRFEVQEKTTRLLITIDFLRRTERLFSFRVDNII